MSMWPQRLPPRVTGMKKTDLSIAMREKIIKLEIQGDNFLQGILLHGMPISVSIYLLM